MPIERRHTARKLYSNACNELAGMTHISTALRKEKASAEPLLLRISAGDSAGNRRLSRTS
jgi:hypothetical protein